MTTTIQEARRQGETRQRGETRQQGVGQPGFTARHGLATPERSGRADEVAQRIEGEDLRAVRLAVVDQHGAVRARRLSPDAAIAALDDGLDLPGTIYGLDTGGNVFAAPSAEGGGFGIEEFTGFPDVIAVPDPATFTVLPWADRTGWMLCDAYFGSGRPVPVDGRALLRRQLRELADGGYDFVCGLELEFYIIRPDDPARDPRGGGYLSEARLDARSEILDAIADALTGLGYPPRWIEESRGPGQVGISFPPLRGMEGADAGAIVRSGVKQVCRRRGLLATFMCHPGLPDFPSSAWHLHQSLAERANGHNSFATPDAPLSMTGLHYVAGLLEHAAAALPFAVPTINGYKRRRTQSFAPDRAGWAGQNLGALVRVQGAPHDTSSHVELRSGEPAANPYLYLASSVAAGLDGIRRGLEPPPPADAGPGAGAAPPLPGSLAEALDTLEKDIFYRTELGDSVIDYLLLMKRSEIARYEQSLAETGSPAEVTPWEMREYFEFP